MSKAKTAVEVLQSIDILSPLSTDDLNRLYGLMNTEHYQEGHTLFREGDSGETMYIVLAGCIAITVKTQDGEVLELAQIPEGSFFGEMSIFDSAKRSATCIPKSETTVLTLKAEDFYRFIESSPLAGFRVMQGMLRTTARRLTATGAFLSDMVTWGEKARARAITDEFTGLYNRRFLEQAAGDRLGEAKSKGKELSYVMLDLDHFGTLNNEYSQDAGDRVILAAADVFRNVFPEDGVPIRYGGDEFTFLLPGISSEQAQGFCEKILRGLGEIEISKQLSGSVKHVSASIGIAVYPRDGDTIAVLMEKADRALYRAKEAGRGRAVIWEDSEAPAGTTTGTAQGTTTGTAADTGNDLPQHTAADTAKYTAQYTAAGKLSRETGLQFSNQVQITGRSKSRITSLRARNQIIERIFTVITEQEHFLLLGHKDPDEDCIASMIAMGLLINKFSKNVSMVIPRKLSENFHYLLNICRYNEIGIIYNDQSPSDQISTVFLMDTPKPVMRESFFGSDVFLEREDVLRIEIDHHLQADSAYWGDPGYCLVDEASSASELVGLLAFKLESHPTLTEAFNIQEIFSRNFVLAVLTGIIGDSKMGKYLKTRRERWFYELFSKLFDEMLSSKTRRNSSNFSTMDQVFSELQKLSWQEEECFRAMMESEVFFSSKVGAVIIEKESMRSITKRFDHDTVVSVARYTADVLAEKSRSLSLVAYPDGGKGEHLIQFRVRRSQFFKDFDLRKILETFSIENGGGHPGAIGFRLLESEISDIMAYCRELIRKIEDLLEVS